jgi:biopolymer transport protein ExbD
MLGTRSYAMTLSEAAEFYCDTYNPAQWHSLGSELSSVEIYNHIVTIQKEGIKNNDFMETINQADRSNYINFYNDARKRIESLIGKPWTCLYFDQFYFPKQTITSITLGEVSQKVINPNDPSTIVIAVSYSGEILVNNSPLVSKEADVFKSAIALTIRQRNTDQLSFIVYADEGSDGALSSNIMQYLAEMGIRKVGLISN